MVYTPIKADDAYDAGKFKTAVETLRTIEGGLEGITKDPTNPDLTMLLGDTLRGDAMFYSHTHPQNPGIPARVEATNAYKEGSKNLTDYVMNNSLDIAGGLDAGSSKKLLASVEVKSENEKFKEYISLLNERREIQAAAQEPEKMLGYVAKKIKGAAKWEQASFGYLNGSEYYTQRLFNDYATQTLKKLGEVEKGLSEEDIKSLVLENTERAKGAKDGKYFNILTEAAIPRK